MTAALPMGGQKITGMADPSVATDGATKAYTDSLVASFFSTGDVKLTLKNGPDPGWLICNDGTFGSASSNSSNRANNDTQALFTLFYNIISDAWAPILTSGGGATTRAAQTNAATAWAANCRMTLTLMLGRSPGQNLGEETHLLTTPEIPSHSHANTLTDPGHNHTAAGNFDTTSGAGAVFFRYNTTDVSPAGVTKNNTTGITINNVNAGGGGVHNNMQPTSFLNAMIKL
jgi:microcystin-dependent protein